MFITYVSKNNDVENKMTGDLETRDVEFKIKLPGKEAIRKELVSDAESAKSQMKISFIITVIFIILSVILWHNKCTSTFLLFMCISIAAIVTSVFLSFGYSDSTRNLKYFDKDETIVYYTDSDEFGRIYKCDVVLDILHMIEYDDKFFLQHSYQDYYYFEYYNHHNNDIGLKEKIYINAKIQYWDKDYLYLEGDENFALTLYIPDLIHNPKNIVMYEKETVIEN